MKIVDGIFVPDADDVVDAETEQLIKDLNSTSLEDLTALVFAAEIFIDGGPASLATLTSGRLSKDLLVNFMSVVEGLKRDGLQPRLSILCRFIILICGKPEVHALLTERSTLLPRLEHVKSAMESLKGELT